MSIVSIISVFSVISIFLALLTLSTLLASRTCRDYVSSHITNFGSISVLVCRMFFFLICNWVSALVSALLCFI
jgi:hypothetical protein